MSLSVSPNQNRQFQIRIRNSQSLEHFVRRSQHVGRNREVDLRRRFEIDHQFEFHRLLHGRAGYYSPEIFLALSITSGG